MRPCWSIVDAPRLITRSILLYSLNENATMGAGDGDMSKIDVRPPSY